MENIIPGGYTPFRAFDAEEKGLFDQVMGEFVGVFHTPLAVATQVSNGRNYAFLCDSIGNYPDAESYNALVIIHKSLPHVSEVPYILEIKTIEIL